MQEEDDEQANKQTNREIGVKNNSSEEPDSHTHIHTYTHTHSLCTMMRIHDALRPQQHTAHLVLVDAREEGDQKLDACRVCVGGGHAARGMPPGIDSNNEQPPIKRKGTSKEINQQSRSQHNT